MTKSDTAGSLSVLKACIDVKALSAFTMLDSFWTAAELIVECAFSSVTGSFVKTRGVCCPNLIVLDALGA